MSEENIIAPAEAGSEAIPVADSAPAASEGSTDIFDQATLDEVYDEITKGRPDGDTPLVQVADDAVEQTTDTQDKTEKTDSADPEEAKAEAAAPEEDSADQPNEEGAEQPQAAIVAPNTWSAEMKEKWGDVPPDVQAYVAQRDTESHAEISRMGQVIAQFNPISELLGERQDVFDRHGLSVQEGLQTLLDAQERLDSNPVTALAAIANSFGIDLATTFGGQVSQTDANGQPVNPASPDVIAANHRAQQAEQKLVLQRNREQAREQREEQSRKDETAKSVAKWAEDKPYFEQVSMTMGHLMQANPSADLDTLYDQACHAIPEIRQELTAKANAARAEKDRKEQAKTVVDAKKQKSVNAGSAKPVAPARAGAWDDDTALSDRFDQITSQAG